jgi:hypothetical protein
MKAIDRQLLQIEPSIEEIDTLAAVYGPHVRDQGSEGGAWPKLFALGRAHYREEQNARAVAALSALMNISQTFPHTFYREVEKHPALKEFGLIRERCADIERLTDSHNKKA